MAEAFKETRKANKGTIEWAAFWEGQEMDFELKKKLHEEDGMVRIDVSKETDDSLPFGLITLYTLEWLVVQKTNLSAITADLWRLQQLRVVELRNNTIKSLPSNISKMVNLERLSLDKNLLEKVPKGLGKLPNLVELDLARNRLESFPSQGFEKLEWLDISHNSVAEVPDLTTWKNIKSFWALSNKIKEVPLPFCQTRLDTVNLSDNELSQLPDEFGDLPLISVWLSENNFVEFPSCLTRLRRLGTLDISENSITHIPSDISRLRFLACLEIGRNKIDRLPKSIQRMKHLTRLNVSQNLLTDFPWKVMKISRFDGFARSRADDGIGLGDNPWPERVRTLLQQFDKDYPKFVEEITNGLDSSDSDSDTEYSARVPVTTEHPVSQSSLDSASHLINNPTVILTNECSQKFQSALEQFGEMFSQAPQEEIKSIILKHDGNSERILDELLSTFV